MPEKALSISIAAYNVEGTIGRCIESCLDDRIMRDIELIVVVDGATDNTALIARHYELAHPGVVIVIEKENGGYGSTVNEGMQRATGRYFRLLDGDDWLDRDGLYALVSHCKDGKADIIYQDRFDEYPNRTIVNRLSQKISANCILEKEAEIGKLIPSMWYLTFRTSIMREHPFTLPHHCLYTDSLFVGYQLPFAKTALYIDTPLYHYSISQSAEQSTSINSVCAHLEDNYLVWRDLFSFSLAQYGEAQPPMLMLRRLRGCYKNAYLRTLAQPASHERIEQVRKLEQELLEKAPNLFGFMNSYKVIRLMRLTHEAAYWPLKLFCKSYLERAATS